MSVLGSEHSANLVLDCACSWSFGVMVATFIWTFLLSTVLAGSAGDDAPRAVFSSILLGVANCGDSAVAVHLRGR